MVGEFSFRQIGFLDYMNIFSDFRTVTGFVWVQSNRWTAFYTLCTLAYISMEPMEYVDDDMKMKMLTSVKRLLPQKALVKVFSNYALN